MTGFIQQGGYWAIALMMLAENILPFIPSALIMSLSGYQVSEGELSYWGALLSGSGGAVIGSYGWYWFGRKLGQERTLQFAEKHGRWLTLTPEDIENGLDYLKKHHQWAIVLARLIPALRTVISIPAGIAKVPQKSFLFFTVLGTLFWNALLLWLGTELGENYQQVSSYLDPITTVILVGAILIYIYRLITFKPKHAKK